MSKGSCQSGVSVADLHLRSYQLGFGAVINGDEHFPALHSKHQKRLDLEKINGAFWSRNATENSSWQRKVSSPGYVSLPSRHISSSRSYNFGLHELKFPPVCFQVTIRAGLRNSKRQIPCPHNSQARLGADLVRSRCTFIYAFVEGQRLGPVQINSACVVVHAASDLVIVGLCGAIRFTTVSCGVDAGAVEW